MQLLRCLLVFRGPLTSPDGPSPLIVFSREEHLRRAVCSRQLFLKGIITHSAFVILLCLEDPLQVFVTSPEPSPLVVSSRQRSLRRGELPVLGSFVTQFIITQRPHRLLASDDLPRASPTSPDGPSLPFASSLPVSRGGR